MSAMDEQVLTGVLVTRGKFLLFCMPDARRSSTHQLKGELNVLRRNGRIFFWVPGSEMKKYASDTTLNVPERTTLGEGFLETGKSLEEVLEGEKQYLLKDGRFVPQS